MFSAINKLLDKKQETSLSEAKSDKELADDFLNYFIEKIAKIRLKFHPGIKCPPDDPIPSVLLKKNPNLFIPIWTRLVNISLGEGSMEGTKRAVLLPLIKELDEMIDKDNKKNYKHVYHLFILKLVERVGSTRLKKHMYDNNLNLTS